MASRNPFDTALGVYGVFLGLVMAVWLAFGIYNLDQDGGLSFTTTTVGFIGGGAIFMATMFLTSARLWASSMVQRQDVYDDSWADDN